jgi:acid phosphatase type 7
MHRFTFAALSGLGVALSLWAVPAEARITRAPYLQLVGPDTAALAFRTDTACQPQVRYGPGGDTSQSAQAPASGTEHLVTLTGLQPGTEYTYVVEACGATTT